MLQPTKVKFRKQQRGRRTGKAVAGYGYTPVLTTMSVLHGLAYVVILVAMRTRRGPEAARTG